MKRLWDRLGEEPSLDEILDDPIVRLMMRGDDTGESEVRYLIGKIRDSFVLANKAGAADADVEDADVDEPDETKVSAAYAASRYRAA